MRLPTPYNSKIEKVQQFKGAVQNYFNGREQEQMRRQINEMVPEIEGIAETAGMSMHIIWTAPPMLGHYQQSVGLLSDIFSLHLYEIPHTIVIDNLDRLLGYLRLRRKKFLRTLVNPFEWVRQLIRIPFYIAGFAGFNSLKLESSMIGKIWKFLAGIASAIFAFFGGIWVIIQLLDFLGFNVKNWLLSLLSYLNVNP